MKPLFWIATAVPNLLFRVGFERIRPFIQFSLNDACSEYDRLALCLNVLGRFCPFSTGIPFTVPEFTVRRSRFVVHRCGVRVLRVSVVNPPFSRVWILNSVF